MQLELAPGCLHDLVMSMHQPTKLCSDLAAEVGSDLPSQWMRRSVQSPYQHSPWRQSWRLPQHRKLPTRDSQRARKCPLAATQRQATVLPAISWEFSAQIEKMRRTKGQGTRIRRPCTSGQTAGTAELSWFWFRVQSRRGICCGVRVWVRA